MLELIKETTTHENKRENILWVLFTYLPFTPKRFFILIERTFMNNFQHEKGLEIIIEKIVQNYDAIK